MGSTPVPDPAEAEAARVARERARAEMIRRQAEEIRAEAEKSERDRKEFAERLARIYPAARKALIEARNRGSGAPISIRKASVARETAKAKAKLCRDFQVSAADLEQIIAIGEEQDGTSARRAQAAGNAAAKARANAGNQAALDAIGQQLDRAARRCPPGLGGRRRFPRRTRRRSVEPGRLPLGGRNRHARSLWNAASKNSSTQSPIPGVPLSRLPATSNASARHRSIRPANHF
jgi:hypothetical protein